MCVDLTLRVTMAGDPQQSPVLITARAGGAGTPLIAGGKLAEVQALVFQAVEEALARAQAGPPPGPLDGGEETETPEEGEEPTEDGAGTACEAETPAAAAPPLIPPVAASQAEESDGSQLTLLAFDF